jgi:hypothetical protein
MLLGDILSFEPEMAALNETEVDIQNTKLISYFHKNQ